MNYANFQILQISLLIAGSSYFFNYDLNLFCLLNCCHLSDSNVNKSKTNHN